MSPAAAAGEPLRSASSIIADTTRGYHILKIDGYSLTKGTPTGDYLKSHPFTLGGHRWCIRYHPNGNKAEVKDYISLFLHLAVAEGVNNNKVVKARYQFRFVDDVEEAPLNLEEVASFAYNSGWGYPKFVKREELEESKHLKHDSFAVRCDVVVVHEIRTEETAAPATFVSVPPPNLQDHLRNLLLTKKGADVVFEVGGETFAAHRLVLGARSPVFSAELLGTMKESDAAGVIRIEDMEARVFKALLYFMYTDSMPETEKSEEKQEEEEDVTCQHLLVAADRYNVERLKLICEEKLCKYIDVGTVATVLALAEQHHCYGLKKACFSFLSSPENLREVVSSDGFKHLSRSCPAVMEELVAMLGT